MREVPSNPHFNKLVDNSMRRALDNALAETRFWRWVSIGLIVLNLALLTKLYL